MDWKDPEQVKKYQKEWYEQHRDEVLKRNKEYYEQHRDEKRKYQKEYREQHRDEVLKWSKEYYEQHRDEKHKYQKEYREQNRDKIHKRGTEYYKQNREERKEYRKLNWEDINRRNKKYHEQHRDEIRKQRKEYYEQLYSTFEGRALAIAKSNKRRALKNGNHSNFDVNIWFECIDFFGWKCVYCGEIIGFEGADKYHVITEDHIIALDNNGSHVNSNVVPACLSCNCSKNSTFLEVWYPKQEFYSEDRLARIYQWRDEQRVLEIQKSKDIYTIETNTYVTKRCSENVSCKD